MTKPQLASGPAGAGQRPGVDYPALKNGLDYADSRHAGLAYALKVLAQSYAEHPQYRPEWRP